MTLAALPLTALAFLSPSTPISHRPLAGGGTVRLQGRGPPVLFSSGLFGTMPHHLYSDVFRALAANVTLLVANGPVTAALADRVADAVGAEEVGLLAHSAFDSALLTSPRVRGAVLCDPVAVPAPPALFPSPPLLAPIPDVLVLRAGNAYDPSVATPIPDFLSPAVARDAPVRTFPGVGHADLLDDRWAALGAATMPWMKGPRVPLVAFDEWKGNDKHTSPSAVRRAYRDWVAHAALAHLTQ